MSENVSRPDDILHMGLKEDAAHVRREDAGGVIVLAVGNENIYPKQSAEIGAEIRAELASVDRPRLLLDLSAVKFVCSAFIGKLVELQKDAAARSGEIKVCVTGEHVVYTMKLVRLHKIIQLAPDRQQLLDAFGGQAT